MKALILLLFLFTITNCFGGPAVFNGENIKLLKDNLRFKTTDTKVMSGDSDDPSAVAKSADESSLYLKEGGSGGVYVKKDAGSSTSWDKMLSDEHTSNLLSYGGYDSGVLSGTNGLTCTVGTCTLESTTKFIGDGALKIALSAQAADVVKCYDNTNAQWDNQMVQAEAWVKSSLAGVEMCYWDGSAESNCITYDASDEWRKIKIIEQVIDENSVCYKIKSPSGTDDIFVDASSIFSLKVDGTTKVTQESLRAHQHGGFSSNNTKIPYYDTVTDNSTGNITTFANTSADGASLTINRDNVTVTGCWSYSPSADDSYGFSVNASVSDLDVNFNAISNSARAPISQSESASHERVSCFTGVYNNGDVIRPHSEGVAPGTAAFSIIQFSATHYEQKSVLSDATAESTFTDMESCTVDGSWVTNTTYTCLVQRDGDHKIYRVKVATSGAPTTVGLTINLPTGDVMDTTKLTDIGSTVSLLGTGMIVDSSGSAYRANTFYNSTTAIEVRPLILGPNNYTARSGNVSHIVPMTWASGDYLDVTFRLPIVGLSTKPQIVGTFKPAVRSVSYQKTSGTLDDSTTTIIDFDTANYDQDSLVTPGISWKYTAKESGKHRVTAGIYFANIVFVTGEVMQLRLHKNGTFVAYLDYWESPSSFTGNVSLDGSMAIDLAEGDYIDLRAFQNTGPAISYGITGETNFVNVERIDQAGRLSQEEPKKIQTKILSADVTTDNIDVSDFTYTGLTIGKFYRISGQLVGFNSGVADNFALVYNSAAAGAGTVYGECKLGTVSSAFRFCGINILFKAASTTLYFHTESLSPAIFLGDGSKKESFIQLEEVNMVETNQW